MLTLTHFNRLTRFSQSLFNLPFVIAGTLIPLFAGEISWGLLWILPAFFAARISGMAFNQLIDRNIDAKNQRTKDRPVAAGEVSPLQATVVAWSSLIVFLVVCAQINTLCLVLSPLIAGLLLLYSYMKRLHWSCHFVLGLIHFFGPVMAWAALTGTLAWPPVCLGLASLCFIAGSDIVYARQDLEFDRQQGLFSIPSQFGAEQSLWIARTLHGATLFFLVLFGLVGSFGPLYYGAPLVTLILLLRFYGNLTPERFFSINITVSMTVLIFTLGDLLWRVTS